MLFPARMEFDPSPSHGQPPSKGFSSASADARAQLAKPSPSRYPDPDSHVSPPVGGQPYISPVLYDTLPNSPLYRSFESPSPSATPSPLSADSHQSTFTEITVPDDEEHYPSRLEAAEAAFHARKLKLKITKIHEFHREAAEAETQLAIALSEARAPGRKVNPGAAVEVEKRTIDNHTQAMRVLSKRKDRERLELVDAERKRMQAELAMIESGTDFPAPTTPFHHPPTTQTVISRGDASAHNATSKRAGGVTVEEVSDSEANAGPLKRLRPEHRGPDGPIIIPATPSLPNSVNGDTSHAHAGHPSHLGRAPTKSSATPHEASPYDVGRTRKDPAHLTINTGASDSVAAGRRPLRKDDRRTPDINPLIDSREAPRDHYEPAHRRPVGASTRPAAAAAALAYAAGPSVANHAASARRRHAPFAEPENARQDEYHEPSHQSRAQESYVAAQKFLSNAEWSLNEYWNEELARQKEEAGKYMREFEERERRIKLMEQQREDVAAREQQRLHAEEARKWEERENERLRALGQRRAAARRKAEIATRLGEEAKEKERIHAAAEMETRRAREVAFRAQRAAESEFEDLEAAETSWARQDVYHSQGRDAELQADGRRQKLKDEVRRVQIERERLDLADADVKYARKQRRREKEAAARYAGLEAQHRQLQDQAQRVQKTVHW